MRMACSVCTSAAETQLLQADLQNASRVSAAPSRCLGAPYLRPRALRQALSDLAERRLDLRLQPPREDRPQGICGQRAKPVSRLVDLWPVLVWHAGALKRPPHLRDEQPHERARDGVAVAVELLEPRQ